jgi:two-component system sensor histidine kinase CreC
LRQAIANLLDNAIDFSPAGGEIGVALEKQPGNWRLTVRDHGEGAPDYALPRLFERFYSLPRPATGRKSTGLGLPFVREVAQLHGGDAHFANHPQGGAEVTLEIGGQKTED